MLTGAGDECSTQRSYLAALVEDSAVLRIEILFLLRLYLRSSELVVLCKVATVAKNGTQTVATIGYIYRSSVLLYFIVALSLLFFLLLLLLCPEHEGTGRVCDAAAADDGDGRCRSQWLVTLCVLLLGNGICS